jgi:hypothetical protein
VLIGHAKTSKNIGVFSMNDDLNKAFGYGFVFGVLLSAIPWVFLGGFLARIDLREAAIRAKVAEYDTQTGEFKYKIVDEDSSM